MFNCYAHGWSHIEKPCPLCHPLKTWTSTSASVEVMSSNDQAVAHLKLLGRYSIAISCLKEIANEDFRGNRSSGSVKAYDTLIELGELS